MCALEKHKPITHDTPARNEYAARAARAARDIERGSDTSARGERLLSAYTPDNGGKPLGKLGEMYHWRLPSPELCWR